MADLLSAGDWLDIRAALEDVKDTFFKFPVILRRRTGRKLTNFHENRDADLDFTDYPLLGLKVEDKTDDEAKGRESSYGVLDNAEGYVYFSYQKLLAHDPPFVAVFSTFDNSFDLSFGDGNAGIVQNKDSLLFDGMEHTIIGVNVVGPTESDFQLVKVHYKKQMQK